MLERNPRNPSETETEMAEKLFSSMPISFKMDRKSPQASSLRDSVSKKLFDFLGNYSYEVLAEYIVVLVCNGKQQNQARDDLEAFLGDDSGKFVAWLWDHLFKENYISNTPLDSSNLKAEATNSHEDVLNKEQTSRLPDLHTDSAEISDIPLPRAGRYEPSDCYTNSNCSNTMEVSESLQRWCPSIDTPLTEVNTEIVRAETLVVNKDSGTTDCIGAKKYLFSTVRCSPEIPSAGEQCLHYEYQHQKIAKIDSSTILRRPLPVPRTEQVARGLRSIITEDHQSRPLSMRNSAKIRLLSTAIDAVPHQTAEPRGNVWDRLGEPCNGDDAEMRGKKYQHGHNLIKRERLDCQGRVLQNPRSMRVVPDARLSSNLVGESVVLDNSCGKVISNNHSNECRTQEHSSDTVAIIADVNNSKRKRLYSESNSGNCSATFSGSKENYLHIKAPPKLQGSLTIKYNRLQFLNEVTSEAKGSTTLFSEPACHPVVSASVDPISEANKISCDQLNRSASVTASMQNLVPVSSQLPSKSESASNAECGNANRRPVKDEVLDVKSRLRQVELDILKLRSKQAEMSKDAKPNASSGVQNHSEEDIESRTVLVTNVHFASSKEALLSHFTKCGVVIKVVMLTDTITAQPKGAAYIVFANKDSVDKAVSLSGTSFFSRILTVVRKADMPPGFLVPPQPVGKLLQPYYPQPYRKGSVQRQYTSSHLQWRRDHPASRENLSATTNGLETSNTGE